MKIKKIRTICFFCGLDDQEFSQDYAHLGTVDWYLDPQLKKKKSGVLKSICLNWWCQIRLCLLRKLVFALQCAKYDKNEENQAIDKQLEIKVFMYYRYNWQGKWIENPYTKNVVFHSSNINNKLLEFVEKMESRSSFVLYTKDYNNEIDRAFNANSFYGNKKWWKYYSDLLEEIENWYKEIETKTISR